MNYNIQRLSNHLSGTYRSAPAHVLFGLNSKGISRDISCRYLAVFRSGSPGVHRHVRTLISNETPFSTSISSNTRNYVFLSLHPGSSSINRSLRRAFSSNSDKDLTKKKNFEKVIELLWPSDSESKRRILISMLFLISSKLSVIGIPLFLSALINSVCNKPSDNLSALNASWLEGLVSSELLLPQLYLSGYILSRISSSLFSELRNALFSTVTEKTGRVNASKMFMKIHCLDIDFLLESKSGEISAIFSRGIKAISQILRIIVFQVVPTTLEFTLVTALLCYKVGPVVATVTALTMILYILFTALVTKKRMVIRKNMVSADQKASGLFVDSITNAEAVRYYNSEMRELSRYAAQQADYETHAVNVQKSLAALNFGQQFIFNTGLFLSLWLTLSRIVSGSADFGSLVLVNTLLFQLAIPLNMIGTMYREIKLSFIDIQKFLELLSIQPRVYDMPGAADLVVKDGKIEFRNVDYYYPTSNNAADCHKILDDFCFTAHPGKTVAIVGNSGSGKSTICKMLFRFYDPTAGSIFIDGQDIKTCTLKSLRSSLGIVPQEVVLFNDSIAFNIMYGKFDATVEEVESAAKLAGIHDTIMGFADGYDTIVGERGMKLSGGEKQRIGIARCLLKDPKILVFDEATSSLDFYTESKIIRTFKQLSADKTTIIIAHRLSSMLFADEIVIFSNGKIVEKGSPMELMQSKSGYLRNVIDSQNLRQKSE
ncbi:ABC transporter, ATP-binding protein family member protein [Theileria equi strain WA]|uniref:ABC transporter, ATP-binding protein family member protein n=1 Tax=Theileria equi strain WA TaxID=1537102 RepID=L0AUP8_THEEQ|nr:ABC transporter, ATP-binding protein family member protein [Theileria equi strain WA]AFZ79347.1 ABC transporter, ATP-binding protein family member protein [Theileria equi strain WA]|eukprot:XP_004829013.1 ABC transporter, ATP-binding protein family member protein [Theileria equi strain WA]